MRLILVVTLVGLVALTMISGHSEAAQGPFSEDTETCLECHDTLHPGIVQAWRRSRHALSTTEQAMEAPALSRKVSSSNVPDGLKSVAVGCAECHGLRPEAHKDTFEHNGVDIHVVVTPEDCAVCHRDEARQYRRNLMAHAYGNLMDNPTYRMLIDAINGIPGLGKEKILYAPSHADTAADSCLYCHGTKVQVVGTVTRETDQGEMAFPELSGWPNQGVGRINPDGSLGACSACHPRHGFSIKAARSPSSCKGCHMGPDTPAFKVYEVSRHGKLFASHGKDWNLEAVPWTLGKDFEAPTCAACHLSLLVNTEGDVVVKRSHEVKDRLPYRIFGLIYAHPHPKSPDTTIIRNKDGLGLPTDFEGGYAADYLLEKDQRKKALMQMQAACSACHDRSWVVGHWKRVETSIRETNERTRVATVLMEEVWRKGHAQGPAQGGSPFDEYVERLWSDGWLFYGNSVRFSSAMAGGGDYGVFADGRYSLSKNLVQIFDWLGVREGPMPSGTQRPMLPQKQQ